MRRLLLFALILMVTAGSATGLEASTDCQRWFIAYRNELAHSRSLQRIQAAKRRAKRYAKRKIAVLTTPKPKLVHVVHGPRMNRRQTLRHFEVACGALPESAADEPLISEETPGPFVSERTPETLDLTSMSENDLIAENAPPALPPFESAPDGPSSGFPYSPPGYGGLGGGPGGGPGGGGNGPGGGGTPPPPPPPPVAPVPEPTTFVLLFTGLASVAGAARRRQTTSR
jgi:hypothetical protein